MQPAAPGLRGAVRHEEEMLDRDAAADAAIATLAAMFPHVPAPVLRRTLAIAGVGSLGDHDPDAALRFDAAAAAPLRCRRRFGKGHGVVTGRFRAKRRR